MVWVLAAVALAGPLPEAELRWSKTATSLEIRAPEGYKLAPEFLTEARLSWADGEVLWVAPTRVGDGVVGLPALREVELTGVVKVGLCEKDGSMCRPVEAAVVGKIGAGKSGKSPMTVTPPAPPVEPPGLHQEDADKAVSEALAEASRRGVPVLWDFGAVWCPPCNQLDAELLEADPKPAFLDNVVLVRLDVDHPGSFAHKARYLVTGYPTLVMTDGAGVELSRSLGYPGKEPFIGWVNEVLAGGARKVDPATTDPATVPAERAAEVALEVALAGGDAGGWLARGATATTKWELHLARWLTKKDKSELKWLGDNAMGEGADWIPVLMDHRSKEVDALIGAALQRAIAKAKGPLVADLIAIKAELVPAAEKAATMGMAAGALRASLTGEAAHDRPFWTSLAAMLVEAGQVDEAVTVLEEARRVYPDEVTFHLALGRTLLDAGRPAEALRVADRAVATGYGDNRLRAGKLLAQVHQALGDKATAKVVLEGTLAAVPAPPEGLEVRSWRYRTEIQTLLEGL